MADDSKKKAKKTGWIPLSNSKLEADVAYFEARLSMLDEKPATSHQHAQFIAYTALENILSETLKRLTEQQRRRRKIRAKSEVPLADQVTKDIESIIEEGTEAAAVKTPVASGTTPSPSVPTADPAISKESNSKIVASKTPSEPVSQSEIKEPVEKPGQESAINDDQVAGIEAVSETHSDEVEYERTDFGTFGSENIYLRNALFSENISFLQEPDQDPEEVQEEWGDVEEAEIKENIGKLDTPAHLDLSETGVAESDQDSEKSEDEAKSASKKEKTQPDSEINSSLHDSGENGQPKGKDS